MNIHWFPGHMAKTRRMISESLKLVDGVINLADARLPKSSQNPLLYELTGNKLTMLVLAKADLADPEKTRLWLKAGTLAVSLRDNKIKQDLLKFIHTNLEQALTKRFARPWRVMVVGIPNVGKSTLINLLAGRKSAKVGDRPGITRARQWIKISAEMEMLDMPGILWPKLDNKLVSLKLAASGCIRDEILPVPEVAKWLLGFLSQHYPQALARFGNGADLAAVAEKMGTMSKGGSLDLDKAAELLLRDFRSGRLGRITLDAE
ncbi:MAG: ribosome biogenesis GTPase YlqF [Eubacteriales bacterium]|nr:ribosome biogenesis GTPase YlqF [Eubacteriales bacterium]MDD4768543.1 ribosome biogenesis GTPase YlqF [Eubacteriales bacterium]